MTIVRTLARALTLVGTTAVVLSVFTGCRGGHTEATRTGADQLVIGTENITIAKEGRVTNGPIISGTLNPALQATVRAQVSGSVIATHAEVGQTVRRGELLGELDASAIRDAYTSAHASVVSAHNAFDIATHDLQRNTTLFATGAIAQHDLEASQQVYSSAQASLESANAQLANAQKNLDNTRIIAPFHGIVGQRSVSAGDVVQSGSALFTIMDPSSMQLDASVPSEQLSEAHVGTDVSFSVTGYPGQDFRGTVTRVSPTVDPTTRQVPITVAIPNTSRALIAGLYAEGRLASRTQDGVVVPQSAVDTRLQRPAVVRIHHGAVERVDVTLGIRDNHAETVQVTAGVTPGDTLLVAAAQGITPGTPVHIQASPSDTVPTATQAK